MSRSNKPVWARDLYRYLSFSVVLLVFEVSSAHKNHDLQKVMWLVLVITIKLNVSSP